MTYAKQTWENGPAGGTRLSPSRLNHMEDGIDDAHTAIEGMEPFLRPKATALRGDGSATTLTFAHELNSYALVTQLYSSEVTPPTVVSVTFPDLDTVQAVFSTAPAVNSIRFVVMG